MKIKIVTASVMFFMCSICFGAGRDIEFNVNDLYGNPWVETTIVGGTGPYNVWAPWSGDNQFPVLNNQVFYVGQETADIFVRDTFDNVVKSVIMPFPAQSTHQINFSTAVPEPSSILLTILAFFGIRRFKN